MNMLLRPVQSSLGTKYIMAITGLGLAGFVVIHMLGNLLIFAGRDPLNAYAAALKHNPLFLWTARSGLLLFFVVHILLALRLSLKNKAARPNRYVYEDTVEATWASRHMLLTGLVLLAFILYHLAHFTAGILFATPGGERYLDLVQTLPGGESRHDVYGMVIAGFKNPLITVSYLVAMLFLWLHLWHGVYSMFQSLGLNGPRSKTFFRRLGPVVATILLVGNCSIPLAVYLGLIK